MYVLNLYRPKILVCQDAQGLRGHFAQGPGQSVQSSAQPLDDVLQWHFKHSCAMCQNPELIFIHLSHISQLMNDRSGPSVQSCQEVVEGVILLMSIEAA